ncbi:MAG: 16S rRNA (cytidine(1402)-2'-O)-methyltransferase [Lentisphaeria bacterium]|nr:16S rRNA (cytidine(1402)-2'-O)-methyltransferase [Lentisphaeria bacterium]
MNEQTLISLVATPIGNLEDMTFRAVRILKEVDLIAAEDTRHAKKLLNHYEIKTPLTSYHMHNEKGKTDSLLDRVEGGLHLAMLSDAGTPCISDPGYLMVRDAIARGIKIELIPGASALTYAAAVCGFPITDFHFHGFLPQKSGKRKRVLESIKDHPSTYFFFESPYKMNRLLNEVKEVLGEDTQMFLLREATKLHEEHIHGSAGELQEMYAEKKWKGEFTVAVRIEDKSKEK